MKGLESAKMGSPAHENPILDTKFALIAHLEAKLCQFQCSGGMRGPIGHPPNSPGRCQGGFLELGTSIFRHKSYIGVYFQVPL